ncbi:unnamed protein product [Zymoseptoria tritici ST99CH_1E4]|uniref:Extracellular metalloproteinase n=1 Tax=Zymoseptoria tritici ST99CH_1E4 TaxID=1276532 RepID=A0A2H1H4T6_ZYMTR|nr:unnamed protein product [Zymoseptoria tritici ST99CH_1E4]
MRGSQLASWAALITAAYAHPHHDAVRHSSNPLQARQLASGDALENFRPRQRSAYVEAAALEGDVEAAASSEESDEARGLPRYVRAATRFVERTFPDAEFREVGDHYVSGSGIGHVYFKQTIFGYDIDDADFNVNVNEDGSIFSYGNSFYTGVLPSSAPAVPQLLEPTEVVSSVARTLALPIDPAQAEIVEEETAAFRVEGLSNVESAPKGQLVYYRNGDNELVPAWRLETDVTDNWLTTYQQADGSNQILAVTDYVSDASYEVFPWPINDPVGNRQKIERNPEDKQSSPRGWHDDGVRKTTTTAGNNGIAQSNTDGDAVYLTEPRPQSASLDFRAPFDPALEPAEYINASVIQLFYTSNRYHDLLYTLGFNEEAGNFQTSNFGRGGQGGDSVILNTQDGSGLNNANFATPPDGAQGRMRMYVFNQSTPNRDSSFEAGIVIHEYTHGLSNRLTGGPLNSRCLSVLESGGMGEGWSDFFATSIRVKNSDKRTVDYPIGDYAFNDPKGIRAYVYSTSLTTNPYTYSSLNTLTRVHQFGTVWCSTLYEVLWNLIDSRGNTPKQTPTLTGRGIPTDGKYLAMKLVQDGMALQPCNPTFLQARDAILDAERALTKGKYRCELWKGFAKRGLGEDAKRVGSVYTDGFKVPRGC